MWKSMCESWITIEDDDVVIIDCETYIRSQPVSYEQVRESIETIRAQGVPVRARIDVTDLRIPRVDILGVIRIIWEIHEETKDEHLLSCIEIVGASPRVMHVWNRLKTVLPHWILFSFE